MNKENYFPVRMALLALIIGGAESLVRLGPMVLGSLAESWLFLLVSATILSASTMLSTNSPKRDAVFAVGLTFASIGGVYLFHNRILGIIGLALGYTLGTSILFTAHVLANKDLDSWNDSPASPLGKAGGSVMFLVSILLLIGVAMRGSALLG